MHLVLIAAAAILVATLGILIIRDDIVYRAACSWIWILALGYLGVYPLVYGDTYAEDVARGSQASISGPYQLAVAGLGILLLLGAIHRKHGTALLPVSLVAAPAILTMAFQPASASFSSVLLTGAILVGMSVGAAQRSGQKGIRMMIRIHAFSALAGAFVAPETTLAPPESNARQLFGLEERLVGFTSSPNVLGMLMVLGIALSQDAGRTPRQRSFDFVLYFPIVVASQSRSAIAAFLFCAAVGACARKWPKVWRARVGVPFFWAAMLLSALPLFLLIFDSERLNAITTGRIEIWQSAAPLISSAPLSGYGINGFQELNMSGYLPGLEHASQNAHNQLLESLFTYGILGLIGLIGVFYLVARRMQSVTLGDALPLVLVAFSIASQLSFGTPFRISGLVWNAMLVAILFGLMTHERHRAGANHSRRSTKTRYIAKPQRRDTTVALNVR